ncbi:hypothetical protein [Lysinibacillus xylanilyticus]|uniref:hypothetical protein n=1 Tax=Lysinibacillus xylanilyticus TaxID=582475 RepID=UPI003819C486
MRKHPVLIERKKYPQGYLKENEEDIEVSSRYTVYIKLERVFIDFCEELIETFGELDYNNLSKVITKIKKKDIFTGINSSEKYTDFINERIEKYEEKRKKCIEIIDSIELEMERNEQFNRQLLKNFLKSNKKILNMVYMTNKTLYHNVLRYLDDEFDEKKKKLRKVEIPLLKLVYRAIAKTSPYFYFNDIVFHSDSIPDFSYKVKNNLITPNYVFFYRVMDKLFLSKELIGFTKFKISKKISNLGNDELQIMSYKHNNFRILNTKLGIYNLKMNKVLKYFVSNQKEIYTYNEFKTTLNLSDDDCRKFIEYVLDIGIFEFDYSMIVSNENNLLEEVYTYTLAYSKYAEWLESLSVKILLLKERIEEINSNFSNELYDGIIHCYSDIAEILGIESLEKNVLLYGDSVSSNLGNPYNEEKDISNSFGELISIFPVFDLYEMIQNEFLFELQELGINERVSINDSKAMLALINTNLKFKNYWNDPWQKEELRSPKNIQIQSLKDEFYEYLISNLNGNVVDLEPIVNRINTNIDNNLFRKEAYYSVFYQKTKNNEMVVNQIYPGFGSFFKRFIRYTDIFDKYQKQIRDFYSEKEFEWIEINETLAFNANMSTVRYFPIRYQDPLLRIPEKVDYVDETNSSIYYNKKGFYLESNGKAYKPIISSSLIRAYFPGKMSFMSSIFGNISFLIDTPVIWINELQDNKKIVTIPRVHFKDVIITRAMLYIPVKSIIPKIDDNTKTIDIYIKIRKVLSTHGYGCEFFVQTRKEEFKNEHHIKTILAEFDKPQYIDLNNMLLMRLFINIIRTNENILISEMLPENIDESEYMREVRV